MTYSAAKRKLLLEKIGMFPFVLLGRICGYLFPLKTRHGAFLFFPNGDIGGSPKVNIEITECIKGKRPLIIFSKKPLNNQFREKFNIEGARILDIHYYIDNKLFHFVNFFYRGLIATWVKQQPGAVVLGGECIYFYKVIPHLPADTKRIEVCHLATWLPYSIGFIDDITTRVFSTLKLKEKVEEQYRANNLPDKYLKKLCFIENAIDIPAYSIPDNHELQVYFIGRGSPQKRIHLIAAIAEQIHNKQLPVKFNFVGDVEKIINPSLYPYCKFYGNVKDDTLMTRIYEEADVLLLTSAFEGLPVVVMQMMAYGKVVVSTAVNGIPDYIHHYENGLLINAMAEPDIISEGAAYIEELLKNKDLRIKLGASSRSMAIEKFSRGSFCKAYTEVLGVS